MALLDPQSFDALATSSLTSWFSGVHNGSQGYSVVAAPAEFTTHAQVLQCASTSADWNWKTLPGGTTVLLLACSFSLQSQRSGSGNYNHLELYGNPVGANPIMAVYTPNQGSPFTLTLSVNGVDHGTSAAIGLNERHYLVLRAEISATATVAAYLDGIQFGSYAGDTTVLSAAFGQYGLGVMELGGGQGWVSHVSDLLPATDTGNLASLTGAGHSFQVIGCLPNADLGAPNHAWTPTPAQATHWNLLNEVPADGTTFVQNVGGGTLRDLCTVTPMWAGPTILGVAARYWAASSSGGADTFQPDYFLAGTHYPGAVFTVNAPGFTYFTETRAVSPASGLAWTAAEIAALGLGAGSVGGVGLVEVSQVVLEVASYQVASTQTVTGVGQPSSAHSGTATVKLLPRPPRLLHSQPLWTEAPADYALAGAVITLAAPPLPGAHLTARYAVPTTGSQHAHRSEDQADWDGVATVWTLTSAPQAGTLRVYQDLPWPDAALWILTSDTASATTSLGARLLLVNGDGTAGPWLTPLILGLPSGAGLTYRCARAHPSGLLYVAVNSSVYEVDPFLLTVRLVGSSTGPNYITDLYVDLFGQVWFSTAASGADETGQGVYRWDRSAVSFVGVGRDPDCTPGSGGGPNHGVWSIWVDESNPGVLWTTHVNEHKVVGGVTVYPGAVAYSSDGGATWRDVAVSVLNGFAVADSGSLNGTPWRGGDQLPWLHANGGGGSEAGTATAGGSSVLGSQMGIGDSTPLGYGWFSAPAQRFAIDRATGEVYTSVDSGAHWTDQGPLGGAGVAWRGATMHPTRNWLVLSNTALAQTVKLSRDQAASFSNLPADSSAGRWALLAAWVHGY